MKHNRWNIWVWMSYISDRDPVMISGWYWLYPRPLMKGADAWLFILQTPSSSYDETLYSLISIHYRQEPSHFVIGITKPHKETWLYSNSLEHYWGLTIVSPRRSFCRTIMSTSTDCWLQLGNGVMSTCWHPLLNVSLLLSNLFYTFFTPAGTSLLSTTRTRGGHKLLGVRVNIWP